MTLKEKKILRIGAGIVILIGIFIWATFPLTEYYRLNSGGKNWLTSEILFPVSKLNAKIEQFIFGFNRNPYGPDTYLVSKEIRDKYEKSESQLTKNQIAHEITADYSGDIVDQGEPPASKQVIVYNTIKRQGPVCSSNSSITSYYIRDVNGAYNKRIFSFQNFPSDTIFLNVWPDAQSQIFNATGTINKEKKWYIFDASGKREEKDYMKEKKELDAKNNTLISPDQKYTAAILSRETTKSSGTYVEITNVVQGNTKRILINNDINSVYLANWSPDSRGLYIAGGIWEFSAPARLWRYDTESEKLSEYESIRDFVYPVTIFPEKGVAYMRDKDPFNQEEGITNNWYALNLNSGKLKRISNEEGLAGPLFFLSDKRAFYHVYHNYNKPEQTSTVKFLDIAQGSTGVFLEDTEIDYRRYDSQALYTSELLGQDLFSFEKDSKLFISTFSNPDNQYVVGAAWPRDCKDIVPEKEYIYKVLGSSF